MMLWAGLILVYGLLVTIGGIVGYLKAKSNVSLFSGVASGAVLAIAAHITLSQPLTGLPVATLVAVFLFVTFIVRWLKTRAIMPAGMMAGLSFVSAIVFLMGWLQNAR
jgi:uncharacterized membrane protein (UPF0136 family)